MQNMADFLHTPFEDRLDFSSHSHSETQHNGAAVANRQSDAVNGAAVHVATGSNNNCMDSSTSGHIMPSQQIHTPPSPSTSPSTVDWRVGGPLDTFLVYNDRRKVTSSAKRRRKPNDTNLHQVCSLDGESSGGMKLHQVRAVEG